MTTITDPVIDQWYKDVENNMTFKVVAIEESDASIEVQYLNGDIGEYDLDSWYNSTFDFIEDPEDWSAPFDDIEPEERGFSNADTTNTEQNEIPLQNFQD